MDRATLANPAQHVAPNLLGKLLVKRVGSDVIVARIVEVEAYCEADPASHSARGVTTRNAAMFACAGTGYVYVAYGLHRCLNVVTGKVGEGAAVLMRSARVEHGHHWVRQRRPNTADDAALLRGPGCLGAGLGIDLADGGEDLLNPGAALVLADDGMRIDKAQRDRGPRVGVSQARERRWRWWIRNVPEVSKYRAA